MATKTFTKRIDLSAGTITLSTANESEVFDLTSLPEEIRHHLALHGLAQKLVDSAALAAGAGEAEKWDAIKTTWANLSAGQWSTRRESQGSLLLRALCELSPNKPREEVRAWLERKTKAEQRALELNTAVRKVLARLAKEASEGIDTDSMLSELIG